MSRMTLHRIERGEASVAAGAWVAVALALGLQLQLTTPGAAAANAPTRAGLPDRIRLADYPQLRQLAWQLQGKDEVSPKEALDLYERNWRHIDRSQLTMHEIALIGALASTVGGGRLLV